MKSSFKALPNWPSPIGSVVMGFLLVLVLGAGLELAAAVTHETPLPTQAPFVELPATAITLKKLRAGGYVLYMRHGLTDNTRGDRIPSVDLADCSTQRILSPEGRQMMQHIGESIRKARIPLGELYSSPMCRTRDSAEAAFPGLHFTQDALLMYVAHHTDEQKKPILAHTLQLLSTPTQPGRNRLLMGHAPNIMELMGYFPKEGTIVILQPRGDSRYDYIASVAPAAWDGLL